MSIPGEFEPPVVAARPSQSNWKRSYSACSVGIVILLLLPHFVTIRPWSVTFKLGYIISGDEPHYLLLIGSLVEDGDVNLANNYDAVHAGQTWCAGRFCRNDRRLDHHTYLMLDNERVAWSAVYQPMRDGSMDVTVDAYQRYYRPTQPGIDPIRPGVPEYSVHQPGIAFVLAPLVYWVRGTRFLEPIALLVSAYATFIGLFYYRQILALVGADNGAVTKISAVAFLGTSVWFYSRSLFLESYLLMSMCSAYYLVLSGRRPLLAGGLIGLAVQLKAYYLLAMLPLAIDLITQRNGKDLFKFCLPIGMSGGLFLYQNYFFFGDCFTGPQPYVVGSFADGAWGHWFSRSHGLLATTPVLVVALVCWPNFLRRHPRHALVLGSAFVINFVLMSFYAVWWGATCYGPRYLTPFIPFLFVSLAAAPQWLSIRCRRGRLFWLLAAASIAINASAVFYYAHFWDNPPVSIQAIDACRNIFPQVS